MKKTHIESDNMYTLWDVDNKRPVGIFRTVSIAARYIFPKLKTFNGSMVKVRQSANKKWRLKEPVDGYTAAVRISNPEHKELLGTENWYIFEGYRSPGNEMKSFLGLPNNHNTAQNISVQRHIKQKK